MMVRVFYTFPVEGFCPANSEKRGGKAGVNDDVLVYDLSTNGMRNSGGGISQDRGNIDPF
jgi:hypothetical protein